MKRRTRSKALGLSDAGTLASLDAIVRVLDTAIRLQRLGASASPELIAESEESVRRELIGMKAIVAAETVVVDADDVTGGHAQ